MREEGGKTPVSRFHGGLSSVNQSHQTRGAPYISPTELTVIKGPPDLSCTTLPGFISDTENAPWRVAASTMARPVRVVHRLCAHCALFTGGTLLRLVLRRFAGNTGESLEMLGNLAQQAQHVNEWLKLNFPSNNSGLSYTC